MKRAPFIFSGRFPLIGWQPGLALMCALSLTPSLAAQGIPGMALPTRDPVRSEIGLNRGIVDFEQDRFGEALERLANVAPNEAGASYYRGLSLLALRRAKEQLRQFEAVSRKPGAPAEVNLDL